MENKADSGGVTSAYILRPPDEELPGVRVGEHSIAIRDIHLLGIPARSLTARHGQGAVVYMPPTCLRVQFLAAEVEFINEENANMSVYARFLSMLQITRYPCGKFVTFL